MEHDSFRKGCRVRLSGLSVSVLNGAEGCIVGSIDKDNGRHPVKLLKPPEAVAAYPQGVKVKPVNLELVQAHSHAMQTSSAKKKESRSYAQAGAAAGVLEPSAWAVGLSAAEQAEWLVDCYRMRVDDDYAWGGGNLHGLYDPEHTGDSIVSDFLIFCKLAVHNGVVPQRSWDWARFLDTAADLLGFAFEKEDAKEKYGGENVFTAMMGGRSLRATAEFVYGTSCMAGAMGGGDDMQAEQLREEIEAEPLDVLLANRQELFADVGGAAAWRRLQSRMVAVQ